MKIIAVILSLAIFCGCLTLPAAAAAPAGQSPAPPSLERTEAGRDEARLDALSVKSDGQRSNLGGADIDGGGYEMVFDGVEVESSVSAQTAGAEVAVKSVWSDESGSYTVELIHDIFPREDKSWQLLSYDREHKRLTARQGNTVYELDYKKGLGKASYSPDLPQWYLENSDNIQAESRDGRYKVYRYSWLEGYYSYDEYFFWDTVTGGISYIMTRLFGGSVALTGENELLYMTGEGICAKSIFGGEGRLLIEKEQVIKLAREQLGFEYPYAATFDLDIENGLIVLGMYNQYMLHPEEMEMAEQHFRRHYPNSYLAVYDMEGNFVRFVTIEGPILSRRDLLYSTISASNGIASVASRYDMDYMGFEANGVTIPQNDVYSRAGNRAYYSTVDGDGACIVHWRGFEGERSGSMAVPKEWGSLIYAFPDRLIFRNPADGSCWQSDWEGNLTDSFVCGEAAGLIAVKWAPLPDFSGVLYVDSDNYYTDSYTTELWLWDRESGSSEMISYGESYNVWSMPPRAVGEDWVLIERLPYTILIDLTDRTAERVRWGWFPALYAGGSRDYLTDIFAHTEPVTRLTSRIKKKQEKLDAAMGFSNYLDDGVRQNQSLLLGDTLCYFTGREDGMYYCTFGLKTGEHKSVRINLPAGYDNFAIITVTDGGSVIFGCREGAQWRLYSRDADI